MGKAKEEEFDGLHFVILLAIAKQQESKFRKDMFKSRRKPLDQIWTGPPIPKVSEIVRFAPSACNSQPWRVDNQGDHLDIYRQPGKRGILPAEKVSYYNRIDMGIFLCFLELCLEHEGICFHKQLHEDLGANEGEKVLAATYWIH